jgi:hypothetical protein
MSVSLCRNFLNPFLTSPVSAGMREGLNATRLKRFETDTDDTKAWRDRVAFGPIIQNIAAVGEEMSDAI